MGFWWKAILQIPGVIIREFREYHNSKAASNESMDECMALL
jgi:hypothetical protein